MNLNLQGLLVTSGTIISIKIPFVSKCTSFSLCSKDLLFQSGIQCSTPGWYRHSYYRLLPLISLLLIYFIQQLFYVLGFQGFVNVLRSFKDLGEVWERLEK